MRKMVAMVFAGGRADEMSVLTLRRPKSAVVFGGSFRMIDFALSNLARTPRIAHVGLLTQYRPSSLVEHVGTGLAWDFVGSNRSIRVLPPYVGQEGGSWYRGTADALYQNIDFLDRHQPDDVLIVSGDHAYSTSFEPLLRLHIEKDADATLGFTAVSEGASRFGIGELGDDGRLVSYREKPEYPRSNLASMTVYVFKRSVLIEELSRHAESVEVPRSFHIYDEILPSLLERRRVYGWVHHGPWHYARTLDDYYRANRCLIGDAPSIDLQQWQVQTNADHRSGSVASVARISPTGTVVDSVVSPGCVIEGRVERSILSPGVRVERGAVVRDSVLWHDTQVKEAAVVDRIICDKRCVIEAGARAGEGDAEEPNREVPASLTSGVSVLGMDVCVPKSAHIGRNCIVYPGVGRRELHERPLASGSSLHGPAHARPA